MTYEHDPVRWTQSPMDAPEALRAPLKAACGEGPSELQMKALALKLAALSAGGTVAGGAATAKASTTAGAAAGGTAGTGAFSVGKIVASLVLMGAAAGAVVWNETRVSTPRAPVEQHRTASPMAPPEEPAPVVTPGPEAQPQVQRAPAAQPQDELRAAPELSDEPRLSMPGQPSVEAIPAAPAHARRPARKASRAPQSSSVQAVAKPRASTPSEDSAKPEHLPSASTVEQKPAQASELELLRSARAALSARPREAFALTEEHREKYPAGLFAQERDALAVEALVRAGDKQLARSLAEQFVRRYPNSPHAHRFREKMGIE